MHERDVKAFEIVFTIKCPVSVDRIIGSGIKRQFFRFEVSVKASDIGKRRLKGNRRRHGDKIESKKFDFLYNVVYGQSGHMVKVDT